MSEILLSVLDFLPRLTWAGGLISLQDLDGALPQHIISLKYQFNFYCPRKWPKYLFNFLVPQKNFVLYCGNSPKIFNFFQVGKIFEFTWTRFLRGLKLRQNQVWLMVVITNRFNNPYFYPTIQFAYHQITISQFAPQNPFRASNKSQIKRRNFSRINNFIIPVNHRFHKNRTLKQTIPISLNKGTSLKTYIKLRNTSLFSTFYFE